MWSSVRSSSGSLISARKWGGRRNSVWPATARPSSSADRAGRLRQLSGHCRRVCPVKLQPTLHQPSLSRRPEETTLPTNGLGQRRQTKPTICSIRRQKSFAEARLLAGALRKQHRLRARLSLNVPLSLNEQPNLNDQPNLNERSQRTIPQPPSPPIERLPPTSRLGPRQRTKPMICS